MATPRRLRPLLAAIAVCAALATPHSTPAAIEGQPPPARPGRLNLIAIVSDDQAHWSIGAYGNTEARTPNLDRLAREGALFSHAFTPTPVCSPSRASYLTGRYGTEVGITDWISPEEGDQGAGLPSETLTWPEVLQQAGYRTALFGKWHLGTQPQFHPTRHGYDRFVGFLGGATDPMNPTLTVGREAPRRFEGPAPDVLTDEAIRFLRTAQGEPFAISIHYREPHLPYGPVPLEDRAPFADLDPTIPEVAGLDEAQVKTWTRDYYASVHAVDRNVGRILSAIEDLGLANSTVVMFTSDHGYMIGHHGLHSKGNAWWVAGGVRGPQVPNMYDESLRIPLIVRGPMVQRRGMVVRDFVSVLDTFASVLGMLGVDAPAAVVQRGRDFTPLLRGEPLPVREAVYAQYDLHHGGLARMRAVRTARWKLVRHYGSRGLDRLFDLEQDPGEERNLFGRADARQAQAELQLRLDAWMRDIGDPQWRE